LFVNSKKKEKKMKTISHKKQIAVIGTVGVPACYGGFESLVDNLLDYAAADSEFTVFCSAKKYAQKFQSYKGARLVYLNLDANGFSSIAYDFFSMLKSLKADVILVLGVSGCIFLPLVRILFRGKIIVNIDGLEWKRGKWNRPAKFFLHASEKSAVKFADVVIGDNKGITDYVKSAYRKNALLIPYGGDQAQKISDDLLFEKFPFCKNPYAVCVCRIEIENNVHTILEAFSQMPEKNFVAVGNWERSDYGKNLREKFSAYKNIFLVDAVYENHTLNWIRGNADFYVHGHSAGGTNPSLVEAMNLSLCILAFDCVYNRETTENSARYWNSADELKKIVSEISAEEKKSVAEKMKVIAQKSYTWKIVAQKYNSLF
jgi:glycosyltransferase involved in cell wall biosynthesis